MLDFDLEAHVTLLQGFDRTGRRIFGSAWRGTEALARPTHSPETIRAKRIALTDQVKSLAIEAVPHQEALKLPLSASEHQAASDNLGRISNRRSSLVAALRALPDLSDSFLVSDHASYERREAVERELREAFDSKALTLLAPTGTVVEWRLWSRLPDFRIYFALSMVRVPRAYVAHNRRLPVFVPTSQLEAWLLRFGSPPEGARSYTPEEACEIWLAEQVRLNPTKNRSKEAFEAEAQESIDELSKRAFERAWQKTVPQSWAKAGRRRIG